jgi:nucleotide-binding universal stress UspA family protein
MFNILVALDGSDHARSALELASDIATKYGATLHVINAIESTELPDALRRYAESEHIEGSAQRLYLSIAERMLDAASAEAKELGVKDVKPVVRNGDPAEQIVDYAKEAKIDMIVMGSKGLSDIRGLLLGSVSHKVSHLAPCTCVTVR